jgi:hypothetical protein
VILLKCLANADRGAPADHHARMAYAAMITADMVPSATIIK